MAKTVRQHVLFDYNGSQLCPGEITTQFRREISIYTADFVILTPNMIKLKISKIMRAVLSSEIDTYGSFRREKNSASQRYSFSTIQISI